MSSYLLFFSGMCFGMAIGYFFRFTIEITREDNDDDTKGE